MRVLFLFLLVTAYYSAHAQVDEDAEPLLSPRVLALDSTLSMANRFNEDIGRIADGYVLAFTDKSKPKTVMQVYKTENNETLRIEYKYTTDLGDSDQANGKPVVNFQRITGDVSIIAKIYNYLFNTAIDPGQITAVSTLGTDITYHGQLHQLILEPDDYSPGYWTITFIR